jgi:hypothetical protein
MTRRALVLASLGLVLPRRAAAAGFHVTGTMTATDEEREQGYFSLGKDLQIVARQDSPVHGELRKMVGAKIQVDVFTI